MRVSVSLAFSSKSLRQTLISSRSRFIVNLLLQQLEADLGLTIQQYHLVPDLRRPSNHTFRCRLPCNSSLLRVGLFKRAEELDNGPGYPSANAKEVGEPSQVTTVFSRGEDEVRVALGRFEGNGRGSDDGIVLGRKGEERNGNVVDVLVGASPAVVGDGGRLREGEGSAQRWPAEAKTYEAAEGRGHHRVKLVESLMRVSVDGRVVETRVVLENRSARQQTPARSHESAIAYRQI